MIRDTFQSCKEAQLALHTLLRSLGFDIAYKKVLSPARVQHYLGFELVETVCEMVQRGGEDGRQKAIRQSDYLYGRLGFGFRRGSR